MARSKDVGAVPLWERKANEARARKAAMGLPERTGHGKRYYELPGAEVPAMVATATRKASELKGTKVLDAVIHMNSEMNLGEGWARRLFDRKGIARWEVDVLHLKRFATGTLAFNKAKELVAGATGFAWHKEGLVVTRLYRKDGYQYPNMRAAIPKWNMSLKKGRIHAAKRFRAVTGLERYSVSGAKVKARIGYLEDHATHFAHTRLVPKAWDGASVCRESWLRKLLPEFLEAEERYGRAYWVFTQGKPDDMLKGGLLILPDEMMPEGVDVLAWREGHSSGITTGVAYLKLQPAKLQESPFLDWISAQNLLGIYQEHLPVWLRDFVAEGILDIREGRAHRRIGKVESEEELADAISTDPEKRDRFSYRRFARAGVDPRPWHGLVKRAWKSMFDQLTSFGKNERFPARGAVGVYLVPASAMMTTVKPGQARVVDRFERNGRYYASILMDDREIVGWESLDEIPEEVRHLYEPLGKSFVGAYRILGGADNDDATFVQYLLDHEGKLRLLVFRRPNRVGEYVLFDACLDGYIVKGIPRMDPTKLPVRIDQQPVWPSVSERLPKFEFDGELDYEDRQAFLAELKASWASNGILSKATFLDQLATCVAGSTEPIWEVTGERWGSDEVIDATVKTGGPLLGAISEHIPLVALEILRKYEIPKSMESRARYLLSYENKDMPVRLAEDHPWDRLLAEHASAMRTLKAEADKLRQEARGIDEMIATSDLNPFSKTAEEIRGHWGAELYRARLLAAKAGDMSVFFEVLEREARLAASKVGQFPDALRTRLTRAIMGVCYQKIEVKPESPDYMTVRDGLVWMKDFEDLTLEAFQSVGRAWATDGDGTVHVNDWAEAVAQPEYEIYSIRVHFPWLAMLNIERRARGEPQVDSSDLNEAKKHRTNSHLVAAAQYDWAGRELRIDALGQVRVKDDTGYWMHLGNVRVDGMDDARYLGEGLYEIVHSYTFEDRECRQEFYVRPVELGPAPEGVDLHNRKVLQAELDEELELDTFESGDDFMSKFDWGE